VLNFGASALRVLCRYANTCTCRGHGAHSQSGTKVLAATGTKESVKQVQTMPGWVQRVAPLLLQECPPMRLATRFL